MKLILATVAGLAGLAASAAAPNPNRFRRDLEPRATSTFDKECISLATIGDSMPTRPPEIEEYEAIADGADPCDFTTPSSLQDAYASYQVTFLSWLSEHSSEVMSAVSRCPELGGLAGDAGQCTAPPPRLTAAPTATPGADGEATSSSTSDPAARETGNVFGAMVIAVLGAVIVL